MLEEFKKEEDTFVQTIGTTLQREQLEQWKEGDISPHDFYGKLQSNQDNPTLLTGKAYDIWNLYYRMYNPGKSIPEIYQLHNTFGDVGIAVDCGETVKRNGSEGEKALATIQITLGM